MNHLIEQPNKVNFDITKYHKCGGDLYWHGCYDSDIHYKQFVTPESYAHPAKISFLLVERIFKHLEHLGLLKEGITICDFMSGSGRIPLMASLKGYKSVGVELEPHFTKMCEDNKKFAENKIGRKLNFEIIQGDSRQLSKILNKGDVGITSPPFEQMMTEYKGGIDLTKTKRDGDIRHQSLGHLTHQTSYNPNNPSNIGNLPYKEMVGVVSPPYQDAIVNFEDDEGKRRAERLKKAGFDRKNSGMLRSIETKSDINAYKGFSKGYSQNPQNIGNLKDSGFVGITSPLYDNRLKGDNLSAVGQEVNINKQIENMKKKGFSEEEIKNNLFMCERGGHYSGNSENIGNQNNENYLSAMLQVYQEAYKSGMQVITTITKNPTRAGKLRRLDIDTAMLLEKSGFKIIDYHRAILFKTFEQSTLTGETKKEHKGRLSFFKRLSLAKGNQASMWEDVLVAVRK